MNSSIQLFFTDSFEPTLCVRERLDQDHLHPLGEHRDTHVTVGARTSDPLHRRRPLYLKSYLDSLFVGNSEPVLGLRAAIQPDLYSVNFSEPLVDKIEMF